MKLHTGWIFGFALVLGSTLGPVSPALGDHHEGAMGEGEKKAASSKAHEKHGKHGHKHKKNCGHKAEKHGDHTDYEHDGHHHKGHKGHVDECSGPEAEASAPAKS